MSLSLLFFLRKRKNLRKVFIFIQFFLVSCSKDESPLEAPLRTLMIEAGGLYTLLGDKPITVATVFTGPEEMISLEGLSEESVQKIEYREVCSPEQWQALSQYLKKLKLKRFCFAERNCINEMYYKDYYFVNLDSLKNLIMKYQVLFSSALGSEISFDQIMGEIEDPNSLFWNQMFVNHYLTGILLGYGEENSRAFCSNQEMHFLGDGLPAFAVCEQDTTVQKYREQQKLIQKTYENQDFLKKTLELLQ